MTSHTWRKRVRGIDGLSYGSAIYRYVPKQDWKAAIELVPAEFREDARDYLVGLFRRGTDLKKMCEHYGAANVEDLRKLLRNRGNK